MILEKRRVKLIAAGLLVIGGLIYAAVELLSCLSGVIDNDGVDHYNGAKEPLRVEARQSRV